MAAPDLMNKIISLAKRRGFIFPGSEIYGGFNGFWDYGPYGVELRNNIKKEWWKFTVQTREDVVGVDTAIIANPKVWEASGHLASFTDPMVDCRQCKQRFRADHLAEDQEIPLEEVAAKGQCPACGTKGELTEPRPFNLMFKTYVGPVEDSAAVAYLRPETCQGIFVNFDSVRQTARKKVPFGIAQIGKAFRNEVNPRNFIFRSREFEQMELEFFVKPGEDEHWHEYWKHERLQWFLDLGIRKENLQLREHEKHELSHYAKSAFDVEYNFPFGWKELEGIANRTDFDLQQHAKASGQDLRYFDEVTKEKYFPYVIEPSLGVDRALLAFLLDAYHEEEVKGEERVVLRFHPKLAPIKAAILPLVKKDPLGTVAKEIYKKLQQNFSVFYDESGSIGRRYRRQDELGTPYCLTVDFDSLEDQKVTVRDRDTLNQERVSIEDLPGFLLEKIS
ncbi:MAG: glycine--tRNA ligase [bacterium]